jgi:hypothetical protein
MYKIDETNVKGTLLVLGSDCNQKEVKFELKQLIICTYIMKFYLIHI